MTEASGLQLVAQTERWVVFGTAVFGGTVLVRSALRAASNSGRHPVEPGTQACEESRIDRADRARERTPAMPRYVLAGLAFAIAGALLADVVTPTVAYAFLCLSLAARFVIDQVAEERAPRRRSALLGRSRRIDPVLLIWIGVAALSSLLLVPWVLDEAGRVAAIVVIACAATMVALAWRIASAPPLLLGTDLEAEQIVDRETRATRTGAACFFAVAAVAVFLGFSRSPLAPSMLLLSFAMAAWSRVYARRLGRTPLAS